MMAVTMNNFRHMEAGHSPATLRPFADQTSTRTFRRKAFSCRLGQFFRKPKNWVNMIRELLLEVTLTKDPYKPATDAVVGLLLLCRDVGKLKDSLKVRLASHLLGKRAVVAVWEG